MFLKKLAYYGLNWKYSYQIIDLRFLEIQKYDVFKENCINISFVEI